MPGPGGSMWPLLQTRVPGFLGPWALSTQGGTHEVPLTGATTSSGTSKELSGPHGVTGSHEHASLWS